MPVCRQCGKQWPEGYAVCPDDGMRITVVPGGYGTPPMQVHGAAAPTLAIMPDEDLPAGSQAGEYVIERKLGEGGMGAVYGARHPLIGKRAAIKVIKRELSASQEAVDRFIREAQAVNQIGHPNIVDVFGFGRLPDGRSFFVMEWLDGESLRDRMLRPLPFAEALEYLEAIATALQAAHEAGVLHRDLKPDNVFLQKQRGSDRPKVKLLDFGLAKLSNSSEANVGHTRTGIVMGTPLYLSPEQAKGAKVDLPTDVYSLGAMSYEMLTGVVPFKADSAVEIMAMHISRPAMPLVQIAPWTPPELEQLVLAMLAKDAAHRPTVGQVHQALVGIRARATNANIQAIPTGSPQGVPAPAWTPPPVMPSRLSNTGVPAAPGSGMNVTPYPGAPAKSKKGLLIGLAAVIVLGAGGAIAFVMSQNKGAKAEDKPATDPVAKLDTPKPDVPKPDVAPPKVDPPKVDPPKVDPPKVDPPKVDPPKVDPPKVDPPKVDPPKVDTPKMGTVVVTIDGPPKAQIFVDGKPAARGRNTVEVSPGTHVIRAQAAGFKTAEAKVRVEANGRETVKLTLEKKPASTNNVHDPFSD